MAYVIRKAIWEAWITHQKIKIPWVLLLFYLRTWNRVAESNAPFFKSGRLEAVSVPGCTVHNTHNSLYWHIKRTFPITFRETHRPTAVTVGRWLQQVCFQPLNEPQLLLNGSCASQELIGWPATSRSQESFSVNLLHWCFVKNRPATEAI